jgi:peptide-methionine (S)-S-oxide reductase
MNTTPVSGARREIATFGGGCFWCLEAVFERLRGVERVESGYAGGTVERPSYKLVCTGTTGHAEVIQITFDPAIISYRDLLSFFFAFHDPTTLNRQGVDSGTQYRSIILTHDAEQDRTAREVIGQLTADAVFARPIVTEVTSLTTFYRAEDEHQGYYRSHPTQGYCQAAIAPKMAKLRQHYAAQLKAEA